MKYYKLTSHSQPFFVEVQFKRGIQNRIFNNYLYHIDRSIKINALLSRGILTTYDKIN